MKKIIIVAGMCLIVLASCKKPLVEHGCKALFLSKIDSTPIPQKLFKFFIYDHGYNNFEFFKTDSLGNFSFTIDNQISGFSITLDSIKNPTDSNSIINYKTKFTRINDTLYFGTFYVNP